MEFMFSSVQSLDRLGRRGDMSGGHEGRLSRDSGVYVPCIYSHARRRLPIKAIHLSVVVSLVISATSVERYK